MRSRTIKAIAVLVVITSAFFISSVATNGLDRIKVTDQQQIVNPNCDNKIRDPAGKTYNLGKCEYILTELGWPLTVEHQYTFLAIEKPNLEYNFTVDPGAKENKDADYIQLSSQVSDPDFLCSSKICLFQSDNHLVVFVALLLSALPAYLFGAKLWHRNTR